jgi:hypothetical protein
MNLPHETASELEKEVDQYAEPPTNWRSGHSMLW